MVPDMARSRHDLDGGDETELLLSKEIEDTAKSFKGPFVSVRSLEDGSSFDEAEKASLWKRVVMAVQPRRRKTGLGESQDDVADLRALAGCPTTRAKRTTCGRRLCWNVPIAALAFLGVVHLLNFLISLGPMLWDRKEENYWPQWGEPGGPGYGLATYPTDLTRDVIPAPCHSHNDYWRRIPLFEAIHYGCISVEADVWLFDDELYVGHNTASLTRNRTLRSLYVDPLVGILERQNPSTEFVNATRHGVFDEDPEQTLVLLIDFKNSGQAIWPVVLQQLGALRSRNYLTYFNGRTVIQGPITVVATGNAPFDLLTANSSYRDVFFDAPLGHMWEEPIEGSGLPEGAKSNGIPSDQAPPASPLQPRPSTRIRSPGDGGQGSTGTGRITDPDAFTSENSFYASVSFRKSIGYPWRGRLSERQIRLIRGQIQGAKRRGLKARYWSTPNWPIGLRNHIWEVLVNEGADVLNVDDLRAATKTDWSKRKHRYWP